MANNHHTSVTIADKYGNNLAVICPRCARPFVVSEHLSKKAGRTCPHCENFRHRVSGGAT